jgi:hypothetical protein
MKHFKEKGEALFIDCEGGFTTDRQLDICNGASEQTFLLNKKNQTEPTFIDNIFYRRVLDEEDESLINTINGAFLPRNKVI